MADNDSVPNNIYTVLVLVALIALLGGLIYIIMRSNELFGSWNPMDAAPKLQGMLPLPGFLG